ncbi:hypothetical protein AA0472_1227 [Acetobacter estunensis NRIC 0472]|nr:hypothetical protein AA0472_1227 [Acetobacter estunensis NRIC 0472]
MSAVHVILRAARLLAALYVGYAVTGDLRAARAEGAFNAHDLTILGETLHFIVPPPSGVVKVAIAFNPDMPQSRQEAEQIREAFGGDLSIAGMSLQPSSVSLSVLEATPFAVVIATEGTGTAVLQHAVVTHHAVCVTGHLSDVTNGTCQIYLTTQPSVDIRLNEAATEAADVHFATAFRIMVHTL